MCPPISCCHRRSPGPLPALLYFLARLLLASTEREALSPGQRRRLPARLDALWHRWHQRPRRAVAPHWLWPGLGESWLLDLLERACCRQALRRLVPLREALLGPRHRLGWRHRRQLRRLCAAAETRGGSR